MRLIYSSAASDGDKRRLLKRCRLMVANDSAMMHLAAASGIPTIGLFGPTKDQHYRPWGENGFVVRTPDSADPLMARLRSCPLYTSPCPRASRASRMPSSTR